MIERVIEGHRRDLGGGMVVSRMLPVAQRRMIGPFVFFDHMGPIELAPGQGFDVRPHPHIGLSTVTYLYAGENTHRDSLGNMVVNRAGDLNVMTAGAGIVHSERADPAFRQRGGLMHGAQIWVALPEANEDDAPSFAHHPEATLPAIAPADGVRGRVLIGAAFGARSPVVHPSAPVLVDLELVAGARVAIAADVAHERGVFVLAGELAIAGEVVAVDRAAVLAPDAEVTIVAATASRIIVLGGAAFPPRFIEWNFVGSSRERIDRAKAAWRAQTMPKIPGDDQEFTPLPEPHAG